MDPLRSFALSFVAPPDPLHSPQFNSFALFPDKHDDDIEQTLALVLPHPNKPPAVQRALTELLDLLDDHSTDSVVYTSCLVWEEPHRTAQHDPTIIEPININWEQQESEPPPLPSPSIPRAHAPTCTQPSGHHNSLSAVPSAPSSKAPPAPRNARGVRDVEEDSSLPVLRDDDTPDVARIIKQLKTEERRVRNRESAHRSNERKRALKLALEGAIGRERARACELRLLFIRLREENRRLRNEISRQ